MWKVKTIYCLDTKAKLYWLGDVVVVIACVLTIILLQLEWDIFINSKSLVLCPSFL